MIALDLESRAAAACANASYAFKAAPDCELIWTIHAGPTSAGIYASTTIPGWYLLSFRGSEELADWLINLRIWPRLNRELHHGYAKAWESVHGSILEQLQELPVTHLTCTGHSMGGALATLAAYDIPLESHLITFGSPKLASPSMAALIEEEIPVVRRYVYGGDICPLYPVALHSHIGAEHQVGPERSLWRMITHGLWDHRAKGYVLALAQEQKSKAIRI